MGGKTIIMQRIIKDLGLRMAPKTLSPAVVKVLVKLKLGKVGYQYARWYLAGSTYRSNQRESLMNKGRIYIAYDGCFDLGVNFQKTVDHGWLYSALYWKGIIHPTIHREIVTDHKEEYPVEYLLYQLLDMKELIKSKVVDHWQTVVIYSLLITVGNLA